MLILVSLEFVLSFSLFGANINVFFNQKLTIVLRLHSSEVVYQDAILRLLCNSLEGCQGEVSYWQAEPWATAAIQAPGTSPMTIFILILMLYFCNSIFFVIILFPVLCFFWYICLGVSLLVQKLGITEVQFQYNRCFLSWNLAC